jgi:hypothetical protein
MTSPSEPNLQLLQVVEDLVGEYSSPDPPTADVLADTPGDDLMSVSTTAATVKHFDYGDWVEYQEDTEVHGELADFLKGDEGNLRDVDGLEEEILCWADNMQPAVGLSAAFCDSLSCPKHLEFVITPYCLVITQSIYLKTALGSPTNQHAIIISIEA